MALKLPGSCAHLSHTRKADDMYLFAKSVARATIMLEGLMFTLWTYGPKINEKSSQLMMLDSLLL